MATGSRRPGVPDASAPTSMTPMPSCVSSTVTALRGLIESQRASGAASQV